MEQAEFKVKNFYLFHYLPVQVMHVELKRDLYHTTRERGKLFEIQTEKGLKKINAESIMGINIFVGSQF